MSMHKDFYMPMYLIPHVYEHMAPIMNTSDLLGLMEKMTTLCGLRIYTSTYRPTGSEAWTDSRGDSGLRLESSTTPQTGNREKSRMETHNE